MTKFQWLLMLCALLQLPAFADFDANSILDFKHQFVPEIVASRGKSGLIGFAFFWLRTTQEGGPNFVTNSEVEVRSTRNGCLVQRDKSDSQGKFKIRLEPGMYSVQAKAKFRNGDAHVFTLSSLKQVGKVKLHQFRKVALQFGTD